MQPFSNFFDQSNLYPKTSQEGQERVGQGGLPVCSCSTKWTHRQTNGERRTETPPEDAASQMEKTHAGPPLPSAPLNRAPRLQRPPLPEDAPSPTTQASRAPPRPSSRTPWGVEFQVDEPGMSLQRGRFLHISDNAESRWNTP